MRARSADIQKVFKTASLGAPEKAVGFVLWRLVHRYMRLVDSALSPLNMTHLQFMTLALTAWLSKSGNPVTQIEVARQGDMHPMQVSLMLKTLEKKSFVLRSRGGSDTRAKHLELTREGLALLHKALPLVVEVQHKLFGKRADVDGNFLRDLLTITQQD